MSRWKTNFEEQKSVQQVKSALLSLASPEISEAAIQSSDEYTRLVKALKFLELILESVDSELFHPNTWVNFPNWLKTINNNIVQFVSNKSVGNLQNANNTLDEILNVLRPLETGVTAKAVKAAEEASESFKKKVIEELDAVKRAKNEQILKLQEFGKEVVQTKKRLDENNQVIEQQKARLDQSISEFQKQFSAAQDKRSEDFLELFKSAQEKLTEQAFKEGAGFDEFLEHSQFDFDEYLKSIKKTGEEHLTLLNQRKTDVEKIFGAIGATAFAGNFKQTADDERNAANLLRRIALGLMGTMILVAGIAFYYSLDHPTEWEAFLFRMGTVLVLGVPAFYAANESSKHRLLETKNRKIQMELASIDAYLVLLPKEKQDKIKDELSSKFFGVRDEIEAKGEEVTKKDLFGIVANIVASLSKGK